MSLQSIRNISSTAKRNILSLLGKVTIDDVRKENGPNGEQWVKSVQKIRDDVETQVT
jgi:hypothetical protein